METGLKQKPRPAEAFSLFLGKLDDIKIESNIDLINLTLMLLFALFFICSFTSLGVSF